MAQLDAQDWTNYGEALAFIGNSLLAPMSQTDTWGIDPGFWECFPDFDDEGVSEALDALEEYARRAQDSLLGGEDPVQRASVEYTQLFIGPPRPAAAPWETIYRSEGDVVGFGQPTFEMQRLLREAGLEVSNENNQYADHIGIELLYASVLCANLAQAGSAAEDAEANSPEGALASEDELAGFVLEHPLDWIGALIAAVDRSAPEGYIVGLLRLAQALLKTLV